MAVNVSYRLETPFSPAECCELLRRASQSQATVRMADGWLHAPHVVQGKMERSGMRIYHAGQVDDPDRIYLCAEIVTTGSGSAIVGEFRRGGSQWFWLDLTRFIITSFLLGFPAFIAYGVWKDDSTGFTPSLMAVTVLPVVVWIFCLRLLGKWMAISPDDTRLVREFVEEATQTRSIEEANPFTRDGTRAR